MTPRPASRPPSRPARSRSSLPLALALVTALLPCVAGCEIAEPFSGPGFDAERGVTLDGVGDTVVVALTNGNVGTAEGQRELFDLHVDKIKVALDETDGYVGRSLRGTLFGTEVWTMTAWRDEEALVGFVTSGVHLTAIEEASDTVDFGRFHHFEAATADMPLSWDDALAIFDEAAPKDAE